MLKLSLLRHAKSSRDDPDLDDFDRPLAARGLRDAPEMGKRLAAHGVHPEMIVTSPARRATQTARLIALEIAYPARDLRSDDRLYLASARDLIKIVHAIDDQLPHVMLVGHNPSFTDLANRLSEGGIDNIPTCGYVEIDFHVDHWHQIAPGSGRLVDFNFPKNTGKSAFVPPAFRNPE
ncbi:MAG: SixA phosphatase family protein [Gammaproteobacteria bacterium]